MPRDWQETDTVPEPAQPAPLPDQIVVATDQGSMVLAEIDSLGLGKTYDIVGEIPALGLELVQFRPGTAATIAAGLAEKIVEADFRRRLDARLGDAPEPMDKLLTYLRGVFEQRTSGWSPTLGKNRPANGIGFQPYANAQGGSADPAAQDGSFDLPRLPSGKEPQTLAPPDGSGRRVRVGVLDTQMIRDDRLDQRKYFVRSDGFDDRAGNAKSIEGWRGHSLFILDIITRTAPTAEVEARTAISRVEKDGKQTWTMPLWRLAEVLLEFEDSGVEVLNLSIGLTTKDGERPLVLDRVITRLAARMVVVAAAGNYGENGLNEQEREVRGMPDNHAAAMFPAALDNVLAAGALTDSSKPAAFNPENGTDRAAAEWIDVFAPGTATALFFGRPEQDAEVTLPSTDGKTLIAEFGGRATWTGTSFSAARITGEIADRLAKGKSREEAVAEVRRAFARPAPAVGGTE